MEQPLIVDAFIEIPAGSQNKYEYDKEAGVFRLDRVLYSPMHYPTEYGYLEGTLAEDGDPLDILVLTTFPTFPGCVIRSRVIGVLLMADDKGEDGKPGRPGGRPALGSGESLGGCRSPRAQGDRTLLPGIQRPGKQENRHQGMERRPIRSRAVPGLRQAVRGCARQRPGPLKNC